MNAIPLRSARRKRRRKAPQTAFFLAVFFLIIMFTSFGLTKYYWIGMQKRSLNTSGQVHIYYQGGLSVQNAFYRNGELYVPFDFIKEYLDPAIQWDEKTRMIIKTTPQRVYHLYPGKKEGLLNLAPYTYHSPPIVQEELVYLPVSLLREFYDLEIVENKHEFLVGIYDLQQPVQLGKTLSGGKLRLEPGYNAYQVGEIDKNEKVKVWKEREGWYWIETAEGGMGYFPKRSIALAGPEKAELPPRNEFRPWKPLGQPILLTWEYVYSKTANPDKIGPLGGLHVLSPTWFYLKENGVVLDKADKKYVDWAHSQGRKIWSVFTNDTKIDLTHDFLSDANLRIKAIRQLLDYIERYELDGLDIDFEYMYLKDKENYVQFIRELTPLVHAMGRTVTVYVIFHSTSENWSMCYDHKSLGELADYLIVMAYDQNTVLAGSVASLPWVERGTVRMLQDVPNHKLILGIPFYTRLWKEETDENGKLKTTRRTLTMEQAEKWLQDNKLEIREDKASGQNYAELKAKDGTYRMWLEDDYSLEKRVEIMKKYRLAGVAAWRRGLEKEEVWATITNLLNRRW